MAESTKVRVWKLTRPGEGSWLAVGENALDAIQEELRYADTGDRFEVTVEEWDQADLDALPEFDGW